MFGARDCLVQVLEAVVLVSTPYGNVHLGFVRSEAKLFKKRTGAGSQGSRCPTRQQQLKAMAISNWGV
jgi:hypothetical protein